jgi:cytidylate kinase
MFISLLVILVFRCTAQTQTKVITNLGILESCYNSISKDILKDISNNNKFIILSIDSDSNSFLFEQIFRNELSLNGFVVINSVDSFFLKVDVCSETKVRYEKIKGNENFIRDVLVSSIVSIDSNDNTRLYKKNYSDTLSIYDIDYINNKRIKVYSESLNETGFWNSLLKPLVILASAGLSVYLLFTVRSK